MILKRKRSGLTASPSSTASSATDMSRDPSSSPSPNVAILDSQPLQAYTAYQQDIEASHLHSRTRKRHRDNRPNEKIIHQNTYQILFAAARSPPLIPESLSAPTIQSKTGLPQRQNSLHNFWSIQSMAPAIIDVPSSLISVKASCQDCDGALPMADTDTSMGGMDDNGGEGQEYACRMCRRRVCDTCAVIEIDCGRECLQCRNSTTRKKWVGGIGWVP